VTGGEHGLSDGRERALAEERAATIREMEDLDAAFAEATRLTGEHGALETLFADLRAEVARKMWDTGMYSIAQLAARLGVTKSRADQMLRRSGQPPR
jgi:hypothetical protein